MMLSCQELPCLKRLLGARFSLKRLWWRSPAFSLLRYRLNQQLKAHPKEQRAVQDPRAVLALFFQLYLHLLQAKNLSLRVQVL
jgi:hypothetical protein